MNKAIIVHQNGGPEQLLWEEVEAPTPKAGQVLLRHEAIGLNFIDVYHRTGLYPVGTPYIPGLEGAGVVEEIGAGVHTLRPGDRVAYPAGPLGAYCQYRTIAADRVWPLPDNISFETAAGMMLKGATVEYLIRRTYMVKPRDWVLFHAAAGGVGLIAIQWLKAIGAHVIGTVGSSDKAELALAHGLDHAILYREESFKDTVREITKGQGVHVVYDSIGKDTFMDSLDCLSPRGTMVTFGNATGPVEPFSPAILNQKGGMFVTRPSIAHYYTDPADFAEGCRALMGVVQSGQVKVHIGQTFDLEHAADAHRAIEARTTTGSTVLRP